MPKGKVLHFPATTTMTAQQALNHALTLDLKSVLVLGYDANDELVMRSSRMTCADALWLTKLAEHHLMHGESDGEDY